MNVPRVRVAHGLRPMSGRDPEESHRPATTLELLYDLTFVIGFGTAASELAHALAAGHVRPAVLAFTISVFAIVWAWMNETWFASAYDTDDWLYRLLTMAQMIGVLVMALGIPRLFASLQNGQVVDNTVMVLGYVVMRVPLVFQWLRAAKSDPARRPLCLVFAKALVIAQIGWVVLAVLQLSLVPSLIMTAALAIVELTAPAIASIKYGGLPWHPHHLAERYGLLVIIALGEGLIGTMATLTTIFGESGWSVDFIVLGLAGVGLTFSLWWSYFTFPSGKLLAAHRDAVRVWSYGHIPIFGSIVAIGAGLHAAAYFLQGHSHLSASTTVLTVAVPVAGYVGLIYGVYYWLKRQLDAFHNLLLLLSGLLIVAGFVLARTTGGLTVPLLVVAAVPWVTVLGYELIGHRRVQARSGVTPTSVGPS